MTARTIELPLHLEFDADRRPGHPFVVVDVFTATPLEGNQLGVFTDARGFSAGIMQRLARELNFAETVFVLPARHDGDVQIRIFTPRSELAFAGHPVLGSAFVVASALGGDVVRLETLRGTTVVEVQRSGGEVIFGRFACPAPPWETYDAEQQLIAALGVQGSLLPVEAYSNGPLHVYVALENEDSVAAVRPDFRALGELPGVLGANCFAGKGTRWTTRMFAPSVGIPEDPATGSAAGPLAMHLARHGWIEFGQQIEIHQGDQIGRPSVLFASARGTASSVDSVEVAGSAVIAAHGEYHLN